MSVVIETTVQDVLGCAPFTGTNDFTYYRVTIKTWLMRQGWNGKVIGTMTGQEQREVYTDFDKATELALKYKQPPMAKDRGRRFAAAPYAPKDSGIIRMIQRKQRFGVNQPIGVDVEEEDTSGVNEARVAKMIADHVAAQLREIKAAKPVETIVRIMQDDKVIGTVKGTKHPKFNKLAKSIAARTLDGFHLNVWLFGPTASGKSHAPRQLADAMKKKYYVHGAMSMSHELMGYKDANGKYHTTPFRECYEKGGVCLLDECDSWDPAVTLALNGALANGIAAFPDGMVLRHKDAMIIAAGNTVGAGATAEFVGRNRLDAAFMSRFPVKIEWPRDVAIEKAASGNDAWVDRVIKARARAAEAGLKHAIDPRHSQAGAALIAAGMTMDEAADLTYLAGLPDAQRRTVEGM